MSANAFSGRHYRFLTCVAKKIWRDAQACDRNKLLASARNRAQLDIQILADALASDSPRFDRERFLNDVFRTPGL